MFFVFLIGTEHQLAQVSAAIRHFQLAKNDTLLVVFDHGETAFYEKLRTSSPCDKTAVIDDWTFKDLIFSRAKAYEFTSFCRTLGENGRDVTLFASHYQNDSTLLFLEIVKPVEFYLMDEGTASYSVNFARSIGKNPWLKLLIKSLIYGSKIKIPKSITYFTRFNLPPSSADRSERYFVQKKNNPLKSLISGKVIFLGDSLVEAKLIRLSFYLDILAKIRSVRRLDDFYYFPHRHEGSKKLRAIESLGFEIRRINEPFETYFESLTECAASISSLFATGVLDNIALANCNLPILTMYFFDLRNFRRSKEIYTEIQRQRRFNSEIKKIWI
jgi:hypothetical protein